MDPASALLVLYHARGVAQLPMRSAIRDHLFCWSRHSKYRVVNHNIAFGFDWDDYRDLPIAAVILDTTVLAIRWSPEYFRRKTAPLRQLSHYPGPKLALPQDEFVHTDSLIEFLAAVGATHVGSAAPLNVANAIYGRALPKVTIFQKLTGYLETETLQTIAETVASAPERSIDVGYRAWNAEPWLGSHGQLKVRVAKEVEQIRGTCPDLVINVSLNEADMFIGDEWYRFLVSCRATLGVEGGASIHDHDGSLCAASRAYVGEHPNASFEEVQERIFPDRDGELALFAIGPRHLEACATRTVQLLVEGSYQGILRPDLDYLAIKRDFSNLASVLAAVRDTALMQRIATSAFERVVTSGAYTYATFVAHTEALVIDPNCLLAARPIMHPDRAAELISLAQQRAEHIANFSFYELAHLLTDRLAYDTSNDAHWVGERHYASNLARMLRFTLSPD